eukprot:scaffold88600_cov29-Tisochrysis_lutea.AAC.6
MHAHQACRRKIQPFQPLVMLQAPPKLAKYWCVKPLAPFILSGRMRTRYLHATTIGLSSRTIAPWHSLPRVAVKAVGTVEGA